MHFIGNRYEQERGKEEEIKDNENIRKYIKEGIENEKAIEIIVTNAKEK